MWELTSEQRTNEDEVSYTSYGLRCEELSIADFSSIREEAQRLIDLMNRFEVPAVHAYDVIENYFAAL